MTYIEGQDKLESIVGAAGYTAFTKVVSLSVFEDVLANRPSYALLLVLESEQRLSNYRLHMRFSEIKELNIREFRGWFTQITGLCIQDISSHQWERVRFKITDVENGIISFLCNSAVIEKVENV